MKKVAIVKDVTNFWPIYKEEFEKYGVEVHLYDIWKYDQQQALMNDSFDAFVWRAKHDPHIKNLARRFLYMFNQELKLPTYPDWHSYWHYDDKIAQTFLMQKFDIPHPETHLIYDKSEAKEFCLNTDYPIIYKYPHGAGSANVGILKNKAQALRYVKKVFDKGVKTFFKNEIQKNYVYLQKMIPDAEGDYKIVCFGSDYIHGFFRYNRSDKALASGSGKLELWNLSDNILNLISKINQKLKFDIMSYDLITNPSGNCFITEFSIIYGDLTNTIYDETPIYRRVDGKWQEEEMTDNQVERLIKYLVKTKWNWF